MPVVEHIRISQETVINKSCAQYRFFFVFTYRQHKTSIETETFECSFLLPNRFFIQTHARDLKKKHTYRRIHELHEIVIKNDQHKAYETKKKYYIYQILQSINAVVDLLYCAPFSQ